MDEQYKIGDVSEILNLSNEMIRYYEKYGAIAPVRDEKSKYRIYSIFDIFSLIECLHYKSWGIKIKDIKDTIYNDFHNRSMRNMIIYQNKLNNEIDYLLLKRQRINEIIENQKIIKYNIGNYWVKKIKRKRVFEFVSSYGENFDKITADKNVGKTIFSDDYIFYFDVCVELKENCLKWGFTTDEEYYDKLNIPDNLENFIYGEQFCLCTIVRVGSLKNLNKECFYTAINYALNKGYKISGAVSGMLVGRGYLNQEFCRYFEIQIPVEINPEII
ncbi:MerR family transcriptional regulator [Clostridium sp.]|uniref:MerR family transcriptional regulator n=1 Tax=Clostridium sp. TaxID=1506 RepID=UPI00261E47D3|nr:MerR family transcriptional regulator [Clostridium sp.]